MLRENEVGKCPQLRPFETPLLVYSYCPCHTTNSQRSWRITHPKLSLPWFTTSLFLWQTSNGKPSIICINCFEFWCQKVKRTLTHVYLLKRLAGCIFPSQALKLISTGFKKKNMKNVFRDDNFKWIPHVYDIFLKSKVNRDHRKLNPNIKPSSGYFYVLKFILSF